MSEDASEMSASRHQSVHVLYVVSEWRTPTQTFVRREISAARSAGDRVTVLSLKPPVSVEPGDPVVLRPPAGAALVLAAIRVLLSHPGPLLALLWRAARSSRRETLIVNVASAVLGACATVRAPEVDWVHAHFAWAAASAADGFASIRDQPYSVFPHAHDIFETSTVDGYTRTKLERAEFVAVESESIRHEVRERFGTDPIVARMGVPRSFLATHPPKGGQGVVTVGSLLPKKGHDVLIEAVADLDGAELTIIGNGPEREPLTQLARELGCAERVHFVGFVGEAEIRAYLDHAAIACLASRPMPSGDRDGVPNVLIEAMARGLPVVSTAVSGIPDLVGTRGVVVPAEDVDALRTALRDLLDNPSLRTRLGAAGLAHVRTDYVAEDNWAALRRHIRARPPGGWPADRLDPPLSAHHYLQLRDLAAALGEESTSLPPGPVLDLGCGGRPYAKLFGPTYLGLDLAVTHGRPDVIGVAEDIPVRSSSVATVLSTQQLEHVLDVTALLGEARRVIRDDGILLLSTHGVWPYHPDPQDLWRWTEEGLVTEVEQAGFAVERVHRQVGLVGTAVMLLVYPLGGVAAHVRAGPVRVVVRAVIAASNILGGTLDALVEPRLPRHYVSASYLLRARVDPSWSRPR